MTLLQEAEQLLAAMSRAEKAQLLQWVVQDLGDAFPGVESIPGVCGGDPCIVRTRLPVWVLEQYRRLGASDVRFVTGVSSAARCRSSEGMGHVRAHGDCTGRAPELWHDHDGHMPESMCPGSVDETFHRSTSSRRDCGELGHERRRPSQEVAAATSVS